MAIRGDQVIGRHPAANHGVPIDWASKGAILAVRPDNMGDVVMLTPALRALRKAAPLAKLDLLASPAGSAVVPLIPELDNCLVISPSWQDASGTSSEPAGRLAMRERALADLIASKGYHAMVVFTSHSQSPWPAAHVGMLAGIPIRVVHSSEFGGAVASHWVTPPSEHTHQIDRCLHLLEAVGVTATGRYPALRVPAAGDHAAEAALREIGLPPDSSFAVLAPGASCSARRYPARRFAAVAARVAAAGLPVLVTGTAKEQPLVGSVVADAGNQAVRALPVLDLPCLTAVISRAAVAVTNNSGCMHLADAMGTPVAVAYAGTERVGDMRPRAVPSAVLGRPVPCSPCRQFQCPFNHECLDFPPERLADAALALVAQASGAQSPREEPRGEPQKERQEEQCRDSRRTDAR